MECLVSHLWTWPVATEVSPHIEQEGVTGMPPSLTPARPSAQTHRWKLLRVIHPKLIASGALSYSGFHQKQALWKGTNCRSCIWGWSQRTLVEEWERDTNGEEVSLHGAVHHGQLVLGSSGKPAEVRALPIKDLWQKAADRGGRTQASVPGSRECGEAPTVSAQGPLTWITVVCVATGCILEVCLRSLQGQS